MKRYKLRKYQIPRLEQTNLEPEGLLCDSFGLMISADPLRNMSAPENVEEAGPTYLEF